MDEREILTPPAYAVMSILMFAWLVGIDWTADPLAILAQVTVSVSYPIVIVLAVKLAYLDLGAVVKERRNRHVPE